jgi:hypothetical protein
MNLYTIGWTDKATEKELSQIASTWPDYADQLESAALRCYLCGCRRKTFATPGEAQGFLDYICSINSESNLRALNGVGADGFFIIEIRGNDIRKYEHNGHIIPVPYG